MNCDTKRRITIPKVCEAVDCFEAATETIVVSAGKFGMLTLNLCHECAVKKFEAKRVE
jgi:hypothetical protein